MGELICCEVGRLRLHPENMRRIYPDGDVRQMAQSILAAGGVVQALQVVPDPEMGAERYLVVDGNLRLAGGQSLGARCPLLKCEVIEADHARQLLLMAITSKFVFPKDPISEGLHYQRLVDEGYSVQQIAEKTGISWMLIKGRMRWLELEEEIQELVTRGALPRDHRVAEALLSIPDGGARVKLARRLASNRATIEMAQRACGKLAGMLAERSAVAQSSAPAVALSSDGKLTPRKTSSTKWSGVRVAAQAACEACNVHVDALSHVAEPAWELVTHAAEETCGACSLRELQSLCGECPAVELLRRLARAVAG
jgi:ParB-like chromosome segregation protein Spo0J